MKKAEILVKKYFADKKKSSEIERYTNGQTDGKSWEELTPLAKGTEIMNIVKSKNNK